MSLLLAVTQERISKICVPSKVGNIMLPCKKQADSESANLEVFEHFTKVMMWNLSSMNDLWRPHRRLDDDDKSASPPPPEVVAVNDSCSKVCFLISLLSPKKRKKKKEYHTFVLINN